ncbi:MAG: hypothetical protein J7501_16050 [Bdellovibrio sp.]|nr:hypothetical protein [Bdellovibrio sp.]
MKRTNFHSHKDLTATFKISDAHFLELKNKVLEYLAASCHESFNSGLYRDSQNTLSHVATKAKNISTSGIVIPKSHSADSFTAVHKVLSAILTDSGLGSEVDYWIYPFNVRLKGSQAGAATASYPTEMPHSETWVGCSLRSVLLHIPLMGDVENNSLKVWRPDSAMDEPWLRPLKDYREASEIIKNSAEVLLTEHKQRMILVDSGLLHGTHRNANAGARLSIDLNVVMKSYDVFPDDWNLLAPRQKMTSEEFFDIGHGRKITSPDGDDDIFVATDGMRHPANIKVLKA